MLHFALLNLIAFKYFLFNRGTYGSLYGICIHAELLVPIILGFIYIS